VEPLFAELRDNLKAWIDDFSAHAKNEDDLIALFARFFEICKSKRLYLSAVKSVFFATSIKWCGRIISGDGYKFDPTRISALREMEEPKTAAELGEFIYCCRWMSNSISYFAARISSLTDLLEEAYRRSGKRTKRSIKNIALSNLSWGITHNQAFQDLQNTLRNTVKLPYPKPGMEIWVYTDASDRFWSAVVTQTQPDQLELPIEEQKHVPLAFLGAGFKGAQLGWSTFEKDAYAIFQVFEKLDYVLTGSSPTHIYTDHRNLPFVFAPLALEPALG